MGLFTTPLLAEFSLRLPTSSLGWTILLGGFGVAMVLAVIVYIQDAKRLHPIWTTWLLFLRLSVFAALLVVALNPHNRTTNTLFTPSRVILLVDTSTSMGFREQSGSAIANPSTPVSKRTRTEAIVALMKKTPLVRELTKYHEVSIYTFDKSLSKQPRRFFPSETGSSGRKDGKDDKDSSESGDGTLAKKTTPPTWEEIFKPQGRETRLGDSLRELIRNQKGKTLSAIVVISDGQWNSGVNPIAAHQYAIQNKVRLVSVGVGPLQRPINIRIADVKGPTDVNKGDPYDIKAYVQGDGTEGREIKVALFIKPDGADDKQFRKVEDLDTPGTLMLGKDGVSKEIVFNIKPQEAGKFEYKVEIQPNFAVDEFRRDDNFVSHRVNVVERNLGVLIIAGGPMRDYRFARNMLYRHKNIDVDVWLQTVDAKYLSHISQDADDVLTEFPESFPTRPIAINENYLGDPENKKAVKYDVIISFDPNWQSEGFPADGYKKISDWVSKDAGGMLIVAGDVNTPKTASAPELALIRQMYPVVLSNLIALDVDTKSDKPRPVTPTEKGRDIPFLRLGENETESDQVWTDFEGLYRCYPTTGKKAGAIVYMEYDDPVLENVYNSKPILMASHFFGIGRIVYVGNAELWRLRELDEDYFDRFWVKAVREVGQGRLSRKSPFGTVLLRKPEYYVGETVNVEARLVDVNNKPVNAPSVRMEVIDPKGDPVQPEPKLLPDESRAGYYIGDFPVRIKGSYRIAVKNPGVDNQPRIPATVVVKISQKEVVDPRQNAKVLTDLARDTGRRRILVAPGKFQESGDLYIPLASFHNLFQSVDTKTKALQEARDGNAAPSVIKTARDGLTGVHGEIESLFPNRGIPVEVDEKIFTLWDIDWVLYLIVALLSLEWLTRKLLKLA